MNKCYEIASSSTLHQIDDKMYFNIFFNFVHIHQVKCRFTLPKCARMSVLIYNTPLNLNMNARLLLLIYTRFKKTDILVKDLDRNLAFFNHCINQIIS